jgi:hypothetical protein
MQSGRSRSRSDIRAVSNAQTCLKVSAKGAFARVTAGLLAGTSLAGKIH